MSSKTNKATDEFSKLIATLSERKDKSGPWAIDCFACDEMHYDALHGDDKLNEQVCDSVFIADTAIQNMIDFGTGEKSS